MNALVKTIPVVLLATASAALGVFGHHAVNAGAALHTHPQIDAERYGVASRPQGTRGR